MQTKTVIIKGGYHPQTISFQAGQPAQIIFKQEDNSACLHQVQSTDLDFKLDLAVHTEQTVQIDTTKPGEYEFTCGMNMFHGKVIIKL